MESLQSGPRPVHAICDRFDVSQQAVSKHLSLLSQAGLIQRERKGRENVYHLCTEPLMDLRNWLEGFWADRLGALKALAEEEGENGQHT